MDQFTRRIIGFAVQPAVVDGLSLGRMFDQVIAGTPAVGALDCVQGCSIEKQTRV